MIESKIHKKRRGKNSKRVKVTVRRTKDVQEKERDLVIGNATRGGEENEEERKEEKRRERENVKKQ